jgi:hypothetical protein
MSIRRRRIVRTIPADHEFVPRGQYLGKNHGRPFVGQKFGAANSGRKLVDPAEIAAVTAELKRQGILR